jgi:PDZ domain-containing protein
VRTLLVGGVLFVVLLTLALTLPVPYVILSPGPTFNTLASDQYGQTIIVIDGKTTKATTGHLNMTTVDESTDSVSVFQALDGWLLHDEVVVPRSSVITPGQSQKQVDQQNTQDFATSQDDATAAAFCELGYPKGFGVLDVDAKGPANAVLKPGDFLVSLDGRSIDTQAKLTAVLATEKAGTVVTIGVTRQGVATSARVTLGAPAAGSKNPRIGITVTSGCLAPFTVDLGLGNQIGGPSAGMMFALGIMDKVGTVDLTRGRFIAGTGTIDPSGTVGPIGGIQLKMIAARRAGATIFLAPAGNCSDVVKATPKGLTVVKVSTLQGAVAALEAPNGASLPHC